MRKDDIHLGYNDVVRLFYGNDLPKFIKTTEGEFKFYDLVCEEGRKMPHPQFDRFVYTIIGIGTIQDVKGNLFNCKLRFIEEQGVEYLFNEDVFTFGYE